MPSSMNYYLQIAMEQNSVYALLEEVKVPEIDVSSMNNKAVKAQVSVIIIHTET